MSFFITRFDPGAKYGGYNQFDCQHAIINKFVKDLLKKQVKQGLSMAYALLEEDGASSDSPVSSRSPATPLCCRRWVPCSVADSPKPFPVSD